ncbi:MAG: transglycosylase SLT domain-containing protein [Bacteroidales bacterium]|nr:transglycosylase SLT domain-containing protein [Bacteroidales bacterium]
MNHILHRLLPMPLFVLLLSVCPVHAQVVPDGADTAYLMTVDEANYDSLLNTFYMQQFKRNASRHQNRRASQAYAEFDDIPDSVFVQRLQALHTVVPMTYNAEVRAFIRAYVRIMSHRLDAMLSLSEYYFPMFEETLDRYGVPQELKYLTIVESALNPQATSRAGAAGLWQFIYSTGKLYDLEIDSRVDERRDPFKSTDAAARLLKRLHELYGDWQLAMAAYNCGSGGVNKAIARSGGKHTFWEIYPYLPRETRGYVPKYIAATYIMNYYHEHGLTAGHYDLPLHVDTVHVHEDIHIGVAASIADIPVEQLRQLNPQFRTDIVPASTRPYALSLPATKTTRFIHCEDSIYKLSHDTISRHAVIAPSKAAVVYHKVRRGETYNSIANHYGVSVANLRRWNGKGRKSTLKVGSRLKIYLPEPKKTKTQQNNDAVDSTAKADTTHTNPQPDNTKATTRKETKGNAVYHTVKKNESLTIIAKKYGVTVNSIKEKNNLKKEVIHPGQRLRIK